MQRPLVQPLLVIKHRFFQIVMGTVLLKLVVWAFINNDLSRFTTNDSQNYLLASQTFSESYSNTVDNQLSLLIAPGFPVVLMLLQTFFSLSTISLLLSLTPVVVAIILYPVFQSYFPKFALAAASFILLEPVLFFESYYILTDSFFLFLIALLIRILVLLKQSSSIVLSSSVGLLVSFACLNRSIILYLPLAAFGYLIIFQRKLIKRFVPALLIFIAICGAWILRNTNVYEVSVISSVQYKNLILSEVGGMRMLESGQSYSEVLEEEGNLITKSLGSSSTPREEYAYARERFIEVLKESPEFFVLNHLRGGAGILFGNGSGAITNSLNSAPQWIISFVMVLSTIFSVFSGLLYLLSSFYALYRKLNVSDLILFSTYFLLVSSGAVAYSRFRIPIIPFMLIIFFVCLEDVRNRKNVKP